MIQKIKSVIKSDLVKVTSKTGISSAIKLAANFIVSKILAVFVGPSGLAILGQLNNVGGILQALSTGGITIGVTKYISEYTDDKLAQQKIINNSLKITVICSAICTLFVLLFYKYLGQQFFKTDKYNNILLILGATLILFSLNSVITAIVNGLRNFKLYVIINIATSIITLTFTILFVYYMGVYGALLAFVLTPALVFFIAWFLIRKQNWANYTFLKLPTDNSTLKLLGRFSLMAINNAVVGAIAQIIIRSLITGKMSLDVAGIWDGMNRLSSAYLLLITTSIQVYYIPTLSYIQDRKLLWKEIMKTEKIVLPITFVVFVFIYLFRGLIVDLLFTKEFSLMKDVFIYQLIGDLIRISSLLLAYTMYAKAMTKQLIISDNIFTTTNILICYLFMNTCGYGLNSIYFAYIINSILYLIFVYFFMKHYTSKTYE